MNSGDFKSRVGRGAVIGKFSVAVLTLGAGLMPLQANAATTDAQFHQYVSQICDPVVFPSGWPTGWDQISLGMLCINLASGGLAGNPVPPTAVSANLGTANASVGLASRKKNRVPLDEQTEQPEKGASADDGGWGLLLTPQYGKNNRAETDLENGYQSNLTGLYVGLDYRFADSLVLGGIIGQTEDNATFLNSAGSIKTRNNSFTLYGTWLPSDKVSIDGYLGFGKTDFNGQRYVAFGNIGGLTSGSTNGSQRMAGLSTSYQTEVGRFSASPFLSLDYIKTSFKGYTETGSYVLDTSTGLNIGSSQLALHYSDRSTASFTGSLGARVGTSYGYRWGTLAPSMRLAMVHEFQNNAKQISNELVSTPGFGFSVETDSPDRNYLNIGLGVSAALNGGTQLFIDYDKRTQDKLLSSWAVSVGALMEF